MATSETWKDRDSNIKEHTDWHTVVAWRGLAEVINKLVKKGSRVYIEGRIQTRTFDDKNGNRRHVVEVLADNMLLLDSRRGKDDFSDSDDYDSSSDSDYDSVSYDSHYDNNMDDFSGKGNDIPF